MGPFHENMKEYRIQMEKGVIKDAYRELMVYIMNLRTHFKNKYPDYFVGGLYEGYMDMTYFSFSPQSLKDKKLRIAIVFIHDLVRFEVWLAGYNKQIQTKFWELIKESSWDKYRIVPTTKNADSIIEYVLVENPNFNDLYTLTEQIEKGTLKFVKDIENFLSKH